MIESWDDFIEVVADLREVQKEYFKTRCPSILNKAKKLEREVDSCIKQKRSERAKKLQPELA
ncbi:MAG: hypothetical protein FWB73_03050 [Treponema sp.]|nr:hypothetical protein [Treponema sp.]